MIIESYVLLVLRNEFPPPFRLTLLVRSVSCRTRARPSLDQDAHSRRRTFAIVGALTIPVVPKELALQPANRPVHFLQLAREGIRTRCTVLGSCASRIRGVEESGGSRGRVCGGG